MLGNWLANTLVGATILTFSGSLILGFMARPRTPDGSFKPFACHERTLYFSGDPTPAKVADDTIARRADGSRVEISTPARDSEDAPIEQTNASFIWDVAAQTYTHLDWETKSKITFRESNEKTAQLLESEHACTGLEASLAPGVSQESELLGLRVVRITDKESSFVIESWVSPDLDCFELKRASWSTDGDGAGDHSVTTVLSLDQGEPPANMFSIPPDFVEMSPLQFEAMKKAKDGRAFWGSFAAEEIEKQYRSQP